MNRWPPEREKEEKEEEEAPRTELPDGGIEKSSRRTTERGGELREHHINPFLCTYALTVAQKQKNSNQN